MKWQGLGFGSCYMLLGAGSCIVSSSSLMLQSCLVLGGDQKGFLVHKRVWQKCNCRGGIRCEAAAAASLAQGPTFEPDAKPPSASDVTLSQRVQAIIFYLRALTSAVPLFEVMLVIQPFVLLFDKQRRRAQHIVNKTKLLLKESNQHNSMIQISSLTVWADVTTFVFYKTEIEGWENLPAIDEDAEYVANHQSFVDIYTLFQLGWFRKFISKTSNFLIPIIGWSMYVTGHIPLKRMDKRSQMKGAFSVAAKGGVPIVLITLIGSSKLMSNGLEYTLRLGLIKMIVHPPIRSKNADELCN